MAKAPKKYDPNEIFTRTPSGRYVSLGRTWPGFLADGIWLVQDGRSAMACLIGAKERVPVFALNYRLHAQRVVDAVQRREKEVGHGLSLWDMAMVVCDYFAHVAKKQQEE